MSDLVNIKDERFWQILFDEACVEGQQAERIEKELKKITVEPAADVPDIYVGNKWIPVSERLPEVEKEVLVFAIRKYKSGEIKQIVTTAIYEDGTMLENDSVWNWEDIEGEWNEEEYCYVIPEGWWENKHYNPAGVLNYAVDDRVLAWMPLPEPYKEG